MDIAKKKGLMGKSSKSCRSLMAVRGKDGGFDDILGLIEADVLMS